MIATTLPPQQTCPTVTDLEGGRGDDGAVDDAAVGVDGVEHEEDVDEGEGDHGGAERHQLHVETSHRRVELATVVKVHDEVAGRALKGIYIYLIQLDHSPEYHSMHCLLRHFP